MATWAVTGAAGYIGSHVAHSLVENGINVLGIDNLSTGDLKNLPKTIDFAKIDIRETDMMAKALKIVDGVIHLAGYKYAAKSVLEPEEAISINFHGTKSLLAALEESNCKRLIFSSSCSVYGNPKKLPATEDSDIDPLTPYANSKWMAERLLSESAIDNVSFRYFNVVGSGTSLIEDTSPYNLFPIILNSWEKGNSPAITGSDFMTKDGTAIRDYIHVSDIVSAHLACIKHMESGKSLSNVFNLSLNVGVSVLEVMNKFKKVLGDDFIFGFTERRIGDPAEIYGSSARASKELGWSGNFSLDEMVTSAVEARKNKLKSVQPCQQSARSDLGMQQSQFE